VYAHMNCLKLLDQDVISGCTLAIPCRGNFVVCRCHAISYPSRGSYTLHIFCTVSDNHIHRQNDVSFASRERTNLTNVVLNITVIAARIWERLKHSVSTD